MIQELRVLPPLAIARFGAAATPMDNYDAVVDPEHPLGYRVLRPAETLEVDADSGEVTRAFVPTRLSFTDAGQVRPVAPFLEVWALTDAGTLEPLTTELLSQEGAEASDVRAAYQEYAAGGHMVDDQDVVRLLSDLHGELRNQALGDDESLALITELAQRGE